MTLSMHPVTIESSALPMWTMQADGLVDYVNAAWQTYTGITGEAALGDGWAAAIHPKDIPSIRKLVRPSSTTDPASTSGMEYRFRGADGVYRWHLAHMTALRGQDGMISGWLGTAIDIDDRRRAESDLRAREARSREIIETANDIVYTLRLDGTVTTVNPAVERVLGYMPDEAVGLSVDDAFIPPDQLDVAHNALQEKLAGEETSVYELEVLAKDGHRVTLEINSRLVAVDGEPVSIHGIARDITARKKADALLRVLAEAARVFASDLDVDARLAAVARLAVPTLADWCVVDVVDSGPELRRVAVAHTDPAKLAMAEDLQRRYPPEPNSDRGPLHVLQTGQPDIMAEIPDELLVVAARDAEHLELIRAVGLRSYITVPLRARGRVLGTLTFVSAESGRMYGPDDLAVAEALAEPAALVIDNAQLYSSAQAAEERYRKVFTGVADAIFVADAERRYRDANPAATALLGYSRDELLTMKVDDLVVAGPIWAEDEFARYLAEGHWQGELEMRRKDGVTVPVEALATVVDLPTGPVYLSAVRDVSERHRLERLRRDFLAMVTHDLRTPLAAVKGSAQLLKRRGEYRAAQVDAVLGASGQMQRLIDDLADVVRLEAGYLVLRREPTDLREIVDEAANAAHTASKVCRFKVISPPAPVVGEWDRDRLGQVVANLLENTSKYGSGEGEVVVRVEDGGDVVRLAVTDRGPGIAPEHLPRLFDRFYRADATGAGGLGLGLYISRMLVEAHGGKIWAESEVGQGSTFTVSLPKRT
jgi:PAS domain S-box-containing protein